ncbi:cytochrome c [Nibribacter koreensis]
MKKNLLNLRAKFKLFAPVLFLSAMLFSCSSEKSESYADQYKKEQAANEAAAPAEEAVEDDGKGIGPVKSVEVGADIDQALAANGKSLFEGKCSACHQLSDQKIVGPGLAGVTERRKPEWLMNMIINPEEMTKKDPEAKKLLAEHLTQMTNQNVNEQDARALLEFLRQNDKAN